MSTPLATVDITDLTTHGAVLHFTFTDELGRPHRAFLLRHGDTLRAFENRCPHWSTPLDEHGDHLYDRASDTLVCATHGARFLPDDGHCVSGPCTGDSLTPLAVHPTDDPTRVRITRQGLRL